MSGGSDPRWDDPLDKTDLSQSAVTMSGIGYFAPRAGIGERRLGVFQLDSVSGCQVVPRR